MFKVTYESLIQAGRNMVTGMVEITLALCPGLLDSGPRLSGGLLPVSYLVRTLLSL